MSRYAVIGMGRSGVSAALLAAHHGGKVTIFDEKYLDTPERLAESDQLQAAGVQVEQGWHGRLLDTDFEEVIVSPGFRRNHPALLDAQAAGKPLLSEIEFAARYAKGPIVAITGTNGKSTTTVLTHLMVAACHPNAVLCGNISGSGYPEWTMSEAVRRGDAETIYVCEVSSFQLEWVHEFRPRVASVLNVTPDHFDRHPDFADYQATKFRLYARQGVGDTAILPIGEPGVPLDALPIGPEVWRRYVGHRETPTDLPLLSQWGTDWVSFGGVERAAADLPLIGEHQRINAVIAFEMARAALGPAADGSRMLAGLGAFRGLSHRMERVAEIDGVLFLNNSMCTNPAALQASTRALRQRQVILCGGVTKGLDAREVMAELQDSDHKVILFGPLVAGSLQETYQDRFEHQPTLEAALERAIVEAKPGDAVVLSPGCASAPPFANFRERGEAYKNWVQTWQETKQK